MLGRAAGRARHVHRRLLEVFGLRATRLPLLRVVNIASTFSEWSVQGFEDASPG